MGDNFTMFTLEKTEILDDINSTGHIYNHHSGAKLIFIENKDENRVFSIAFRTQSENDKGTAHIVEHCVLCGSDNYKLKDPFNILDKGSLHTYLNAMTYTDKTIYPIGSINEKDFKAMMRIYCDAVFNPLMYKNEGIFRQEGWHSDGEKLNGVVLNEMKGVYSESSVVLEQAILKSIYRNTPYEYDSGGNPDSIPDLSYEEFLAFHSKNYHPSNSIIYLYGNIDINEYLNILDNEFIGKYEYRENHFVMSKIQADFNDVVVKHPTPDKNVLQAIYPTGAVSSFTKCVMLDIVCDLLFNIEGAYIKEKLSDLGNQVSAVFSDSAYFTNFIIEVSGSDETDLAAFKEKLNNAFKTAEIDDYKLQGVINSYKFYYREEDFGYKPKGLFYNTLLLRSFMYNNYTFEPLKINKLFEEIKNIDIKSFINRYFVNKGFFGILINSDEQKSEPPVPESNIQPMLDYQKQTDDEDEIKKINVSKVSDIPKTPFLLDYRLHDENIYVPLRSDVTYINVLFDTSVVPKELLPALGLWQNIMDIYSVKYANDIDYYLGGFSAGIVTIPIKDSYRPYLSVKIKTLKENTSIAVDIFKKVISQTVEDMDRLYVLINEQKQMLINRYISSGQIRGYTKALSVLSEEYNYIDNVVGINLYKYISDTPIVKICQDINKLISLVFRKNGAMYSVCGTRYIDSDILLKDLDDKTLPQYTYGLGEEKSIAIKSNVNFNCQGFLMDCRHGSFKALQQLITREYIWDKVRLEGGAYGGGLNFSEGRYCFMYSYRDPQLKKTFEVFDNIGNYVMSKKPQAEIDRFILGAINAADSPVKNSMLNSIAIKRKILGIKDEILYQRREELLSTTSQDIVNIGEKINEAIKNKAVCTVGKKEDIEKNINILKGYIDM